MVEVVMLSMTTRHRAPILTGRFPTLHPLTFQQVPTCWYWTILNPFSETALASATLPHPFPSPGITSTATTPMVNHTSNGVQPRKSTTQDLKSNEALMVSTSLKSVG